VISPLLANIYQHYAHYALWAMRWRRREAMGDMIIVRYADDFIVGFQHESEARRFLQEMRERLGKFALSVHPEKTRLIEFGRFAAERRARRGARQTGDLQLPGFYPHLRENPRGQIPDSTENPSGPHAGEAHDDQKRSYGGVCSCQFRIEASGCTYVVKGYFNYHAVPTQALHVFRQST